MSGTLIFKFSYGLLYVWKKEIAMGITHTTKLILHYCLCDNA